MFCSQPGPAKSLGSWGRTISLRHLLKGMMQRKLMRRRSARLRGERPIYPAIAACLNMDMVGRFEKHLILQGIGSSSIWRGEIERRNAPVGLPITLQDDSYLPTDASSFYLRGVPILSAFTGAHSDYHTPRDTPEKLNYEGAAQVARFMGLVAVGLAAGEVAAGLHPAVGQGHGHQRTIAGLPRHDSRLRRGGQGRNAERRE